MSFAPSLSSVGSISPVRCPFGLKFVQFSFGEMTKKVPSRPALLLQIRIGLLRPNAYMAQRQFSHCSIVRRIFFEGEIFVSVSALHKMI